MQAFRLINVVELLKESSEYFLEDVCGLILIKAGAARYRKHKPLVTLNQRLPGSLISISTGQQQLRVTRFHKSMQADSKLVADESLTRPKAEIYSD